MNENLVAHFTNLKSFDADRHRLIKASYMLSLLIIKGMGVMGLYGEFKAADHVFIGRFQFVEKHFLVEHLGEGATHRRHYPDPVRGAPSPRLLFVLHVLHERLGGRVVVRDGNAHLLKIR